MHYTLTVALPGGIQADELRNELETLMDRFCEERQVPLHRDDSVYAEDRDTQLRKAREYNAENNNKFGYDGMSEAEILEGWSGTTDFDDDGWPLTTSNPDGFWDWWVIGGRWGGAWTLRPGAEDGPLATEDSAFGRTPEADEERQTDCARWRDLAPESVTPTYVWLDLKGRWCTRWIGPSRAEAVDNAPEDYTTWTIPEQEHVAGFMRFLADLPGDTWLVQIDFHV